MKHEELMKLVDQAAKDLTPEDLIPYLKAAEKWDDSKDTFLMEILMSLKRQMIKVSRATS